MDRPVWPVHSDYFEFLRNFKYAQANGSSFAREDWMRSTTPGSRGGGGGGRRYAILFLLVNIHIVHVVNQTRPTMITAYSIRVGHCNL